MLAIRVMLVTQSTLSIHLDPLPQSMAASPCCNVIHHATISLRID